MMVRNFYLAMTTIRTTKNQSNIQNITTHIPIMSTIQIIIPTKSVSIRTNLLVNGEAATRAGMRAIRMKHLTKIRTQIKPSSTKLR